MTYVNSSFFGQRVLLLQGPIGPFFWNLAKDLRAAGAEIFKFNFNAGDWLFYPRNAHCFKGQLADWPQTLKRFVREQQIDAVLLFGDCRPVHARVRSLARRMGFAVGVFEEGYLRPDHVTFEAIGVNGHSQFPKGLAQWLEQQARVPLPRMGSVFNMPFWEHGLHAALPQSQAPAAQSPATQLVGNTYWHAAAWGMLYFFVAWLGQCFWNNALHHRRLTVREGPWWLLSFARKIWFRWTERGVQERLEKELRQKFFLVPLQVYNDAQITVHSDYESVCGFIDHVMRSFALALARERKQQDLPQGAQSLQGHVLVFKHHPLDRGERNYGKVLRLLSQRHGLQGRVIYIHDQHLPSLLKASKAVVLVNSTTGLSALGHSAPVKVCGSALYDLPGLTYQGRLDDFWFVAQNAKPDAETLRRFKTALIDKTQLNGSFYRKLPDASGHCGVWLYGQMAERLWPRPALIAKHLQVLSLKRPRKMIRRKAHRL